MNVVFRLTGTMNVRATDIESATKQAQLFVHNVMRGCDIHLEVIGGSQGGPLDSTTISPPHSDISDTASAALQIKHNVDGSR